MTNINRWSPARDMMNLRRAMDRMFDDFYGGTENDWEHSFSWSLPLDVVENGDEYVVKASLPGVNPDDLEITYDNNTLTIRGEMKAEEEKKDERFHLRERRYGTFSRSISLPSTINPDQIRAEFDSGVLSLHLPKTEEVKPRRIAVRGPSSQRTIEGQTKR